jgi:hypothetical protein
MHELCRNLLEQFVNKKKKKKKKKNFYLYNTIKKFGGYLLFIFILKLTKILIKQ